MNVAGIDPGLTGALAIIDEYRVVFVDDLPVHQIHAGKRTRAEIDLGGMRELLTSLTYDHVFIEQVAARPGQGVTSMFRFGLTAGQTQEGDEETGLHRVACHAPRALEV